MIKDFYIKNMVCDRCITVIKNEIEAAKIELGEIELGRVQVQIKNNNDIAKFKTIIEGNGFKLIDSSGERITEQVKIELIKLLNTLPIKLNKNLSNYLSSVIHQDYSKISRVFSITEGITIEKYFIKLKMEKVKELIQAKEENFTVISQLLDYNHVNHLSKQFKAETGLSLSQYKKEQKNYRNALDQII